MEAADKLPGGSIRRMTNTLKNYYLPPHMDFMTNKNIDPFVIYAFEFTHTLDKQDLADIWQNLMPKIAKSPEKQTVVVAHVFRENEFFGGECIPANTQWMVFKIKRKAEKSYFAVTADSEDDSRFAFQFQIGGGEKVPKYNYNWPYDFFSLVELAKLEASALFTLDGKTTSIRKSVRSTQVQTDRFKQHGGPVQTENGNWYYQPPEAAAMAPEGELQEGLQTSTLAQPMMNRGPGWTFNSATGWRRNRAASYRPGYKWSGKRKKWVPPGAPGT